MKTAFSRILLLLCFILVSAGGCGGKFARPVAHGDIPSGRYNLFYVGELTLEEVLGPQAAREFTAVNTRQPTSPRVLPHLPLDSSVLLVQSGAMIPDHDMLEALGIYYSVSPFSGIPDTAPTSDYTASLRAAAENYGCDAILVYWGVIETTQTTHQSKLISWFPLIGGAIPDETQHMRIRLKVAAIETKTGLWDVFTPASFHDSASSSRFSREAVDQGQVDLLKAKAYRTAVNEIVKRYSRELL